MAVTEPQVFLAEPPRARLTLGSLAAVCVGNALEFYDFLTFSFFAVQIGDSLFPAGQGSLLKSLATFGVGFLTRPLGGLLIGAYGDHAGRRPAMLLSFGLMGVGIVGLALTPSYASIGMAAPVLAIAFRLLQGFALGGEVGPSSAFMLEAAPEQRRGLAMSLQYATQQVAILSAGVTALILAAAMPPELFETWGWRVAFLIGAAIVPFGLVLRSRLGETYSREENVPTASRRFPVRVAVLGVAMLMAGTIGTYVIGYMATWAQDSLHLAPRLAFGATIAQGLAGISAALLAGVLSDRFGRRAVMLPCGVLFVLLLLPCYLGMAAYGTAAVLFAATALLNFFLSLAATPGFVAIGEALPKHLRSGALGTIYAVSISVFGGSTQFAVKGLINLTGSVLVPAWYAAVAMAIGLVAMALMHETAPAIIGRRTR
ncbi:MAG TPA: MFS transporter [Stellaceae bacterium]|nr:MFS transporter [Stellaceae bacterium]